MTNLSESVKKKIEEASESFKLSDIPYPPLKNIFKEGCKYGYTLSRNELPETGCPKCESIYTQASHEIESLNKQVHLLEDALKEYSKVDGHEGTKFLAVYVLESLSQLRGGGNE